MNDIEKMLRDGISAEDIIKEVNKTKDRLIKEEEARKKAEMEKAKNAAKVAEARSKAIEAITQYLQILGIELSEEDTKEIIKIIEIYCKQLEDEFRAWDNIKVKAKHKKLPLF